MTDYKKLLTEVLTESEVAALICAEAAGGTTNVIRRMAIERDKLRAEVERLRAIVYLEPCDTLVSRCESERLKLSGFARLQTGKLKDAEKGTGDA